MSEYSPRNARPLEATNHHYPFYQELLKGGKVWRDDKLNGIKEWLTLDHPGIQDNAANISYFGYKDLSL
jgi:hypothetical protein